MTGNIISMTADLKPRIEPDVAVRPNRSHAKLETAKRASASEENKLIIGIHKWE